MSYAVKSIFYTLQGEGANIGRPAVFCRFAGCNLWSGREEDRATAMCRFCDTEFVGTDGPGGGRFRSAEELARAVSSHWPGPPSRGTSFRCLHGRGTAAATRRRDWSPPSKSGDSKSLSRPMAPSCRPGGWTGSRSARRLGRNSYCGAGQELKLVFPQSGSAAGDARGPRFPALLPPAHGWAGRRGQYPPRPALLP